jgi:hypothetical protein
MTSKKFTHDGREFEIRAVRKEQGLEVESCYKGKRIARYGASYETAIDWQHHKYGNCLDALIGLAQTDITYNQLPGLKALLDDADKQASKIEK